MAVKVVDASALIALLFGEPEAQEITTRLVGARLVAPHLLSFELANVCRNKIRRNATEQSALIAAFQRRRRLHIDELGVDADEVLDLALKTGLTAYDASYLWLSRDLGAELVTLDRQLAKAAATI
jgi:predicted nucleic acid-binding protein